MKYKVYWDNGYGACGEFPDTYDTEEEAERAAESILAENIIEGVWDDSASTEVVNQDPP